MPEFKGKKGGDPHVHVHAFEDWAVFKELPKAEWRDCFPQTLKGLAQKWYFNYPPEKLVTYKTLKKSLIQRFKDEKTEEELLSQLGRMKQKKMTVRAFVEEIKDLARQLSSPAANKNMRAWFLNGTSLKGIAKAEITNPTKSFEDLIERAVKMERKGAKRQKMNSSSDSSTTGSSSSSEEDKPVGKSKAWQKEIEKLKKKVEQATGIRSKMPSKGEKWCTHCRVDSHGTGECCKCDYCERRGHKWEECPIRLLEPAVRLAVPANRDQGNQFPGQPQYYRQNYNRPPPRKFICFKCGKEGHFARDCPEVINPPNPVVNQIQPEVAAITRGQFVKLPMEVTKEGTTGSWGQLKKEAIAVTKELQKKKPQWELKEEQKVQNNEPNNRRIWVRKLEKMQAEVPGKKDEANTENHQKQSDAQNAQFWQNVNKRISELSVDMDKLVRAVPEAEEMLVRKGEKPVYELNRTGIRDDQAPVVVVECKIRKHWKPVDKATLDGGAGVNIMSERIRKHLGLTCKPAPFKLRMANQAISEPLGLVEDVPVRVAGVKMAASFLILDVGDSYDMLLGRPWLRAVGAVHDWSTDVLSMKKGSGMVKVSTSSTEIPKANRPENLFGFEPQQLLDKLTASNVIPVATLDLNW